MIWIYPNYYINCIIRLNFIRAMNKQITIFLVMFNMKWTTQFLFLNNALQRGIKPNLNKHIPAQLSKRSPPLGILQRNFLRARTHHISSCEFIAAINDSDRSNVVDLSLSQPQNTFRFFFHWYICWRDLEKGPSRIMHHYLKFPWTWHPSDPGSWLHQDITGCLLMKKMTAMLTPIGA